MVTIKAHFDGKVIVPDEPVDLPRNEPLMVSVDADIAGPERVPGPLPAWVGTLAGKIVMTPDFDDPLEVDFNPAHLVDPDPAGPIRLGTLGDKVRMTDDFDEPLEDFTDHP